MSNGCPSGFGWCGRLDPGTARLSPEPAVDSLPRSQVGLSVTSDQEVERSVRQQPIPLSRAPLAYEPASSEQSGTIARDEDREDRENEAAADRGDERNESRCESRGDDKDHVWASSPGAIASSRRSRTLLVNRYRSVNSNLPEQHLGKADHRTPIATTLMSGELDRVAPQPMQPRTAPSSAPGLNDVPAGTAIGICCPQLGLEQGSSDRVARETRWHLRGTAQATGAFIESARVWALRRGCAVCSGGRDPWRPDQRRKAASAVSARASLTRVASTDIRADQTIGRPSRGGLICYTARYSDCPDGVY